MADTDRFNASLSPILPCVFFFNDTTTTEIYTLSLHDALPICFPGKVLFAVPAGGVGRQLLLRETPHCLRSEEHTSELQSRENLVCRLLLEKKKKQPNILPLRARSYQLGARLELLAECLRPQYL